MSLFNLVIYGGAHTYLLARAQVVRTLTRHFGGALYAQRPGKNRH